MRPPDAPRPPGGNPAAGQEPNGKDGTDQGNCHHQVTVTVDIETPDDIDAHELRWLAGVAAHAARVAAADVLHRVGVQAAVTAVWCPVDGIPDRPEGAAEGSGTRGSEAAA